MYHGVTQKPASPEPETEPSEDADAKSDRKERVLHTRVPAVLEAELKRFANNLRVPVSNLVRTILEDALSVADLAGENVESRLTKAATSLKEEREKLKRKVSPAPLRDVFAFQALTLAQGVSCAKCAKELSVGESAHLGLSERADAPRGCACAGCPPGRGGAQLVNLLVHRVTHNQGTPAMTNETHTNEIPAIDSLKQLGAEWAALGLSFGSQAIGRSALTLRLAARSLNVLGGVLGDAATKLRGEIDRKSTRLNSSHRT